jgi:hypothetical protein
MVRTRYSLFLVVAFIPEFNKYNFVLGHVLITGDKMQTKQTRFPALMELTNALFSILPSLKKSD